MESEIEIKLNEYLRVQVLKRPQFRLEKDDPLISSGLVDSFHLVDLAIFVEDQFGVKISDTELNSETFDTLGQLSELIKLRQG